MFGRTGFIGSGPPARASLLPVVLRREGDRDQDRSARLPRHDFESGAVDLLSRGTWVVFDGSMGIGKSHALRSVIERLRADNWVCSEVRANAATATIPFGALSAWVPRGEDLDRVTMLRGTVERLAEIGQGRPHLVAIDDAPHLDEQSVAVLHQLASESEIPVLLTARSTDVISDALSSLLTSIDVARLELGPMGEVEATELGSKLTGLDVDHATMDKIVSRAGGNPLFVTELSRAHRDGRSGHLTDKLRDAVRLRIDHLDPASKHQLTLVAVADPLDTDLEVADLDALDDLERRGLALSAEEHGFVVARPAHPLYGEVIREGLTALGRRRVARELTDAMATRPLVRRGDALRLAGWLRSCGDEPTPDLAVTAALEAISWLDIELATELVDIATAEDPDYEALFAAGEVARLTGDVPGALEWFNKALESAERDADIRQVSMAMAQIYGFFQNEPDAAVKVLELAASRLESSALRLEVETERALFGSMLGRYDDVLVAARRVLDHPDADDEARWTALTNITWAEAQLIDLSNIDEHLDEAIALSVRMPADRGGEVDLVHAVRSNVDMERGLFGRGQASADAAMQRTKGGQPAGLTLFSLAQMQVLMGGFSLARELTDDALEQLAAFDPFNALSFSLGASSILASIEGDPVRAQGDIDRSVERSGGMLMWDRIWLGRARAWRAACSGSFDEAVALVVEAGLDAMDTSHLGWAVLSLHDAVSWGGAKLTANPLERLRAQMVDAPCFELMADVSIELGRGSFSTASTLIDRLRSLGGNWPAGLAALGAAAIAPSDTEAARMVTVGSALTKRSAPTPAAISSLGPSDRQLDVAIAAASGLSSKEIATDLFVSVRTVDNHLRAVYRLLDVGGRAELADLLNPPISG